MGGGDTVGTAERGENKTIFVEKAWQNYLDVTAVCSPTRLWRCLDSRYISLWPYIDVFTLFMICHKKSTWIEMLRSTNGSCVAAVAFVLHVLLFGALGSIYSCIDTLLLGCSEGYRASRHLKCLFAMTIFHDCSFRAWLRLLIPS